MKFRIAAALSIAVVTIACDTRSDTQSSRAIDVQQLIFPVGVGDSVADPALAVDPATGDLVSSWLKAQNGHWIIQFARSKDFGANWSVPAVVSSSAESVVPHAESAPRLIVTPKGVVAVVWSDSKTMPGRQWPASNIRFSRSTDGGATWSAALTLNDDTLKGPSGHLFHGAVAAGDSAIVVAWMDSRVIDSIAKSNAAQKMNVGNAEHAAHGGHSESEPDAHVMIAQSRDQGATWSSANSMVSPSACPCCRITLARSNGPAVVAAWRQHSGQNIRDIVVARIWPEPAAAPKRVHDDGWVFPGCPHTGPGISVSGDGSTHVSWFTGVNGKAGVYYAASSPNGVWAEPVALSTGKDHPVTHTSVATAMNGSSLVAWEDTSGVDRSVAVALISAAGEVVYSGVLSGSSGADHPQVVALADDRFVVAWAARTQAGPRIAGVTIRR